MQRQAPLPPCEPASGARREPRGWCSPSGQQSASRQPGKTRGPPSCRPSSDPCCWTWGKTRITGVSRISRARKYLPQKPLDGRKANQAVLWLISCCTVWWKFKSTQYFPKSYSKYIWFIELEVYLRANSQNLTNDPLEFNPCPYYLNSFCMMCWKW